MHSYVNNRSYFDSRLSADVCIREKSVMNSKGGIFKMSVKKKSVLGLYDKSRKNNSQIPQYI